MPYSQTTDKIEIMVEPFFLEDRSSQEQSIYVWAYQVQIINHGAENIQLISRFWRITDGRGHVEEVEGEGVVGEQPIIKPKHIYQYASGCPLKTDSGIMSGHYVMVDANHKEFKVEIPAFSLDCPWDEKSIH
ncbi:MAG: Co2+/Mg2+ efflux protein ApaG [Alphaproteobacteria bacterium]